MYDKALNMRCECRQKEHEVGVSYCQPDSWSKNGSFTIQVFLMQYQPFWKRLLNAIGYLFHLNNCKGYFDCFSTHDQDEVKSLRDFCDEFLSLEEFDQEKSDKDLRSLMDDLQKEE